ncbi:hypothetical protein BWI15_16280 [Kribbella sp. ALI-6-A]|uniref:VOC family protein n=1 Tax=Kribbella sp. ALI-6-A TaxID=1933817 RepID=UPI00097BD990|nr:hypothetical protein BWI15_16280 [Kribbella sp. ALI-6-A]
MRLPASVVHINPILNVSDLQASTRFYTEVLDFELLGTFGDSSRSRRRPLGRARDHPDAVRRRRWRIPRRRPGRTCAQGVPGFSEE